MTTTIRPNEQYAREFLSIPTLETQNSDQLDFHEVNVGDARRMLTALASDIDLTVAEDEITAVIHATLWHPSYGSAFPQNSDYLDNHEVSVWAVQQAITVLRMSKFRFSELSIEEFIGQLTIVAGCHTLSA